MVALYSKRSVAAVIAAGGKGSRMRSDTAKQFLRTGGKPIIGITLDTFIQNPLIDEIVVVLPEGSEEYFLSEVCAGTVPGKLSAVVSGGPTRQESVYRGLLSLSPNTGIVLIHDAVRPFAGHDIINRVTAGAAQYKSCVPGVKIKDTVKSVTDGFLSAAPNREMLYSIQTPQGFDYNMIIQAHESAASSGFLATDDSSLAERLGFSTKIIEGSYQNIKITTVEDLWYAEAILAHMYTDLPARAQHPET